MTNDSLLTFIKDQQKLGLDRETITGMLAAKGWAAGDIDEAFKVAMASTMFPSQAGVKTSSASSYKKTPPNQKQKHHGFMVAVILIVVIFFGASAAYGFSTGRFASGLQSFTELFTPSSPATSYDIADNGGGNTDTSATGSGSGSVSDNPLAVPSISIDATPGTIAPGYKSSINWETQNTSSCNLTNAAGESLANQIDGSYVVTPSITSQYTLTCTGAAGTRAGQVTVYVGSSGEPSYSSSGSGSGQTSYGTYTTTYTTGNGGVSSSGSGSSGGSGNAPVNTGSQSATVPPGSVATTQTYVPPYVPPQHVPASSPGVSPSPSPTPSGSPPPSQGATQQISTQGSTQSSGGGSTQTPAKSQSSNPTPTVTASPPPAPVVSPSNQSSTPAKTTTTPSASGSTGSTGTMASTPPVLPTVTLSAEANPIAYGFAPFLTWTDTNATSCSISPFNFSNSVTTPTVSSIWNIGNIGVTQTGPVTYTMTCTNSAGSATAKLTVNVNPIPSGANSPIGNDQALVLNMISGKTPSAFNVNDLTDPIFVAGGNQEIFSTPQASVLSPIGTNLPRNPNIFSGSLDLSFLPVNFSNYAIFNGVLVAPDIMITANHLIGVNGLSPTPNPSWVVSFETNAGAYVSRRVVSGMQIPNTDLYVMRLDTPVAGPGTGITYADVFTPSDFNRWIVPYLSPNNFLPVLSTKEDNILGIANLSQLTTGETALPLPNEQVLQYGGVNATNVPVGSNGNQYSSSGAVPSTFEWKAWLVPGDSGSAEFMDINNTPVVLSTWTTAFTGPNIAAYYDQINAAMTTLGSAYHLTPIDLGSFK